MKIVPLSKAKANLSRYSRLCHQEAVIITINGAPACQLVPIDESDDLISELIERNPAFRRMLQQRLREPAVSARTALERLRGQAVPVPRRRKAAG